MIDETLLAEPLVLFDGECGFCNRIVLFVIERDRAERYRFAPLQSDVGQRVLRHFGLATEDFDSVVFVSGGRVHTRSSAALAISAGLGGVWRAAALLRLVPRPLRDLVYDWVADNRFRLLPGSRQCAAPAALRGRMVDS